jgi:hypothetical protein
MNLCTGALAWFAVVLLVIQPIAVAASTPGAASPLKPEELDQIVAPIALHPDSLLAQILMASTYPLEIVQAARFVKDNPALKGDQLQQALQQHSWDDSVKSMVMFPEVLAMMNEKLDWLQKLGDAFLAQQQDVMAAVQRLRARAQEAGQLKDTPQQKIIVEPAAASPGAQATQQPSTTTVVQPPPSTTVIKIEPTDPEVIYVPSYNPTVVYGAWPPAYPPYYPYPAGYFAAGAFTFAAGAAVGAALWGNCNWGGGDVDIDVNRSANFSRNVNNSTEARNRIEQRNASAGQRGSGKWQHNPEHRKGVQYRDTATQQRFDRGGPANAQSRESFRGRTEQGGAGQQGGRGDRAGVSQPSAGIGDRGGQAGERPGGGGQGRGEGFGGGADRPGGGGQAKQGGAFEGVGGGRDAQSFSSRGNSSRQSFSGSSGSSGSRASSGAASRGGGGGGGRAGGGGGGGRGGGRR